MKANSNTSSGNALIIGSVMLIVTMVLHPSGGSIDYMRRIIPMIIISHTIAMLSMPLLVLGFRRLTQILDNQWLLAKIAFIYICFALLTGLIAASLNGIAIPLLINAIKSPINNDAPVVKMFFTYNGILNQAFDYVFIGGLICATGIWSIAIIRAKILPSWVGFLGIGLILIVFIPVVSGSSIVHLNGFRLFILGFTLWSIIVGTLLKRISVAFNII